MFSSRGWLLSRWLLLLLAGMMGVLCCIRRSCEEHPRAGARFDRGYWAHSTSLPTASAMSPCPTPTPQTDQNNDSQC